MNSQGKNRSRMILRKILSIILFVSIMGIASFYYIHHKEAFHIIYTVSSYAVIVLSILSLITCFCFVLQLKVLTDHYKLNLNFLQCFGLNRATKFTNLFLPSAGGAAVKAIYLKKFHNFNYSSFIASMGIASIIKLMITSLFAIILLWFFKDRVSMFLFVVAGTIFIGTLTFLLFAHRIGHNYLSSDYIKSIIKEWQKIRTDHEMMRKLIMVHSFIFILGGFQIYFAFHAFEIDVSLITCGVIAAFTTIAGVFSPIPGNFGIREAIIIAISGIHGIESNEGLHAAVLVRIIGILWTLVLTPFFAHKLFPEKSKHLMEKVEIKSNQAVQE